MSRGRRIADMVATVLLLVAQAFLIVASLMLYAGLVMSTDNCAYVECGDQAWLSRAYWLGVPAGGVVLLTALVISVVRMIAGRLAFFVPLTGCVLQLGLNVGAVAMAAQAGPTS